MVDMILEVLKESGINQYEITTTQYEDVQLYFIKSDLNMRRCGSMKEYKVTVYNEFEEKGQKVIGSSCVNISPEMEKTVITKKLLDAYASAKYAPNQHFELYAGEKSDRILLEGREKEYTTQEIANLFAKAIYDANCNQNAFVNSAEVFVKKTVTAILNSNGVDVSYQSLDVDGEYIVQCKEPQDVELYYPFKYSRVCEEELKKDIEQSLQTVCDRANAKEPPKSGEYDVILSDDDVRSLLSFYLYRSDASAVYQKYSNYEVGMNVQGEEVSGDKLNIVLSSKNPYSKEGVLLKDIPLMEEGILKSLHGDVRYCKYLEMEPIGEHNKLLVKEGTKTIEELKEKPYLHVVSFSAFECDAFSGHFGGEIRLGYYFDGKEVKLVTGGSVSGNLIEAQKHLTFSKEMFENCRYVGPKMVRIEKVSVAGC